MIKLISRIALLLSLSLLPPLLMPDKISGADNVPWKNWQTSLFADHPLVGNIWSVRGKRLLSPKQLADALGNTRYVLIGEVHDNPDHHRLQAWLIGQIAQFEKPAIVMEMIPKDKAGVLAAHQLTPDANAANLGPALDWAKSGWPAWKLYQPIAEVAFMAKLPIAAGDAERAIIRTIGKNGIALIDADQKKQLALVETLSANLAAALDRDIIESHCNLLPKAMIPAMTDIQRFRDATLARSVVDAGHKHPVVLIAGNGHVRNDRGVPWYLVHQDAGSTVKSVMLLEADADAKTIADLAMLNPDGAPAADYLWITPRQERQDQCEKLKKHFKKKS